MVHTTEKTSSTTPASASASQAAEPPLQRAKGEQHLDAAAVGGAAQVGKDVLPGQAESITRSDGGSLHPGGDASRKAGKQAGTEAAAADASSAHPETPANPDEEIKAGTLKDQGRDAEGMRDAAAWHRPHTKVRRKRSPGTPHARQGHPVFSESH
jgi:hypothetical protein